MLEQGAPCSPEYYVLVSINLCSVLYSIIISTWPKMRTTAISTASQSLDLGIPWRTTLLNSQLSWQDALNFEKSTQSPKTVSLASKHASKTLYVNICLFPRNWLVGPKVEQWLNQTRLTDDLELGTLHSGELYSLTRNWCLALHLHY